MFDIKKHLDEYLEFDSDLIFKNTDYLVVFGGATRDIISDNPENINDIDILCLPLSRRIAIMHLEANGYNYTNLVNPDVYQLYREIKYIFEPKLYIKGDKKVQFITPNPNSIGKFHKSPLHQFNILKESYFQLLSNVDLSSSGTFYDGDELYESIDCSILHCKNKKFLRLPDSMMYDISRTEKRVHKLRWDWTELKTDKLLDMRQHKLYKILNRNKYPNLKDFKNKFTIENEEIFKKKNRIFEFRR